MPPAKTLLQFALDSDLNDVREIQIPIGTSLPEAAAALGWTLRNDCGGQGICGKCRVLVNSEEKWACQCVLQNDAFVTIPRSSLMAAPSEIAIQKSDFLPQASPTSQTTKVAQKPSLRERSVFGVALDLGTTTLVVELLERTPSGELRSLGTTALANPQRKFGDDLIARLQQIIENPNALAEMRGMTRDVVTNMIREIACDAQVPLAAISSISVAGNSVMSSIFLGQNPSALGYAPFELPWRVFPSKKAGSLVSGGVGVQLPNAEVFTLPLLGGFVGGDITAGILATGLHPSEEPVLLIDLGTNGELALFSGREHSDRRWDVAATAAGPALEGGKIEFGCQAIPGAIDQVTLQDDTGLEHGRVVLSTIGNQPARGLCGSGLIDTIAELRRCGLIDRTGRFVPQENSPFFSYWKKIDGKPCFLIVNGLLANKEQSNGGQTIYLTQQDVRQFQLAAIRAGMKILLAKRGLELPDLRRLDIAGGFGSFLREDSMRRVGLIPRTVSPDRVRICGNTSLAGARMALFCDDIRQKAIELSQRVVHHDLSCVPEFSALFAENMTFDEES